MTQNPTRVRRLDTWSEISAWLHLSPRQCRKLASPKVPKEKRLPVFRLTTSDGKNTRVYAMVDALDDWLVKVSRAR